MWLLFCHTKRNVVSLSFFYSDFDCSRKNQVGQLTTAVLYHSFFFSFTVWHFILLHWIVPCNPHLINTAVGDSLLGSLVACASTETIGVLHVGLFDYSDGELSEPEETIRTYYCDDLGFEWDFLRELLAEPEEI